MLFSGVGQFGTSKRELVAVQMVFTTAGAAAVHISSVGASLPAADIDREYALNFNLIARALAAFVHSGSALALRMTTCSWQLLLLRLRLQILEASLIGWTPRMYLLMVSTH